MTLDTARDSRPVQSEARTTDRRQTSPISQRSARGEQRAGFLERRHNLLGLVANWPPHDPTVDVFDDAWRSCDAGREYWVKAEEALAAFATARSASRDATRNGRRPWTEKRRRAQVPQSEPANGSPPWLANPDLSLVEAAVFYGSMGLPVFPVDGSTKRPLISDWPNRATTDEAEIRALWANHPGAAIGGVMGARSGCFAIDLDRPKREGAPDGVEAWAALEQEHGAEPRTHTQETPSAGVHLLFRFDPNRPATNRVGALKGKGIDVRGEGGFVVLAPSRRPDGLSYDIDPNTFGSFAAAPAWLLDALEAQPPQPSPTLPATQHRPERSAAEADRYAIAALEGECATVAGTTQGVRNAQLNTSAMKLGHRVAAGLLDQSEVERRLFQAAQANGMVAEDGAAAARATIRSGMTAGLREPRGAPERQPAIRAQSTGAAGNVVDLHPQPAGPRLLWHRDKPPATPPWLIDGLLPQKEIAFIAGQSQAGKTFVAIDLALSVMLGTTFLGKAVGRKGGCLWLAAEGHDEVMVRLEAALISRVGATDAASHSLPICQQMADVPRLTDDKALDELVSLANEASAHMEERYGADLAMIVVDTLGSAASFIEENSASEVNRVMNSLRRLSKRTGALIVLIDHYGKTKESGMRGSSAKLGAADAVWTISYNENTRARALEVEKLRFGKTGYRHDFQLEQVDVDEDGNRHCAVAWSEEGREPGDEGAAPRFVAASWTAKKYQPLRQAMDVALGRSGKKAWPYPQDGDTGPQVYAVDEEQVRSEFYAAHPIPDGDTRRQAWRRAIRGAKEDGLLQSYDCCAEHLVWYAKSPAPEPRGAAESGSVTDRDTA